MEQHAHDDTAALLPNHGVLKAYPGSLHHCTNLQDQNKNKSPNFILVPWQNI